MAAVAREPGAAAVPTVAPPVPRPPDPVQNLLDLPLTSEPPLLSLKEEDRRHVPEKTAVSSEANTELALQDCAETNANANAELMIQDSSPELLPDLRPLKPLSDPSPGAEQDPVQSAVSPLSLPAAPEAPEAGLSLGQPNGPDRACTGRTQSRRPERSELFTALPREERSPAEEAPETEASPEPSPELRPGTHVRVSLDHVIDDALVVSYRVGHKVFSGVLMDLSRRFGPYGIPITVVPPRRELSRRHVQSPPPAAEVPPATEAPPPDPAPLFHQGAPYPPPLFLRDSYHTNLPQPPPRRIKRSRRRYGNSEEPTCMLVRLRPRQVLCDRCKGAAGPRAPPVSTRRRHNPDPPEENLSAEVKRLRCDEPRPPRPRKEGPRTAGGGASVLPPRRLATSSSRDARSTADQKNHRETATRSSPRAASGPAHAAPSRVLTRRISSALTPPLTPPRVRLKPHRYRTETEPQDQTRTRPGPQLTKTRTRTPPPLPPRRSGSKPGSKPECKSRAAHRKDSRPEPGPKKETKVQPKLETETRTETRTKTRPVKDQDHPRPDPKSDSDPEPRPRSRPAPELIPVSPSRSRRKQVFPRSTRDFDLDFMGWSGPDSDPDRTEPRVKPEPSPEPDQDHKACEESPEPDPESSSETGPGPDQSPDSDLDQDHIPLTPDPQLTPVPEIKPEPMDPDPGPDLESEPGSVLESGPWSPASSSRSESESRTSELSQSVTNPAPISDHSTPIVVTDLAPVPDSAPEASDQSNVKLSSEQRLSETHVPKVNSDQSLSPTPRSDASPAPLSDNNLSHAPRADIDLSLISTLPSTLNPSSDPLCPDITLSEVTHVDPVSPDDTVHPDSAVHSDAAVCTDPFNPDPAPPPDPVQPEAVARTDPVLPDAAARPDPVRPSSGRSLQKCVGADGRLVGVGDIVWAKIAGFPWWPARVLSLAVCRRGDGGVAARREVRVAWFGSRTTSLLPLSHSSPFLETFQTRFDRKRKGPYRRAVAEAAAAAKQLTPEVRALVTLSDT